MVHNASFVEIMAFGACLDVNPYDIFDVIYNYAGNYWMSRYCVTHMLENEMPYLLLAL